MTLLKKAIAGFLILTIIICMHLLLITTDISYLSDKFVKADVYSNFTEEPDYLNEKFNEILNFMNLSNNYLDKDFYSQEDIRHMQDVQGIYQLIYLTLVISSILLLFLIKNSSIKISLTYPIYAWVSMLILAFLILLTFGIDFSSNFVIFHEFIFTNDYWILDPATSNLIKFLPETIFADILFDLTMAVFMSTTLLTLFAIIGQVYYSKWLSKKTK